MSHKPQHLLFKPIFPNWFDDQAITLWTRVRNVDKLQKTVWLPRHQTGLKTNVDKNFLTLRTLPIPVSFSTPYRHPDGDLHPCHHPTLPSGPSSLESVDDSLVVRSEEAMDAVATSNDGDQKFLDEGNIVVSERQPPT